MRTVKTDQSGQMDAQANQSLFAGRTVHFVGFVMLRLISEVTYCHIQNF